MLLEPVFVGASRPVPVADAGVGRFGFVPSAAAALPPAPPSASAAASAALAAAAMAAAAGARVSARWRGRGRGRLARQATAEGSGRSADVAGAASPNPVGRRVLVSQVALLVPAGGLPSMAVAASLAGTAPAVVASLWGAGLRADDIERWVAAFSEDCVYEDLYYADPAKGKAAVAQLLREKVLPKDSRVVVDRISDGRKSCGFTWHIAEEGVGVGQRGLAFVRLDDQGKICFVRELGEPLFKAGVLTEKLLEALTKDQPPPVRPPLSAVERTPKTAGDIVRYLYGEVQQSGGDAARFYSEDVVYEDMNYDTPFVGKAAVEGFLARFQAIQGVTFNLEDISDGTQAVGFTYTIEIKGQPRGIKGATFYEVDREGKVCYVRDVPESATKPPPVQYAARLLRPGLRRLQPSPPLPGDIEGADPLLA
mmetsp:Transcript_26995/g.89588  ORF Transcript_26995/g.89588 Transcript_26995/m.89588 type:complete len:424 (-) Transcript_26995:104-1375(-)